MPQYTQEQNDKFKLLFGQDIPGFISRKDSLNMARQAQLLKGQPPAQTDFDKALGLLSTREDSVKAGKIELGLSPRVTAPKDSTLAEKKYAKLTSAQQDTAALRDEGLIPKLPTPRLPETLISRIQDIADATFKNSKVENDTIRVRDPELQRLIEVEKRKLLFEFPEFNTQINIMLPFNTPEQGQVPLRLKDPVVDWMR